MSTKRARGFTMIEVFVIIAIIGGLITTVGVVTTHQLREEQMLHVAERAAARLGAPEGATTLRVGEDFVTIWKDNGVWKIVGTGVK